LAPSDYRLFPGLKKTIEREVGRAKDLSSPPYNFKELQETAILGTAHIVVGKY
jgi:hypothetical protein